MIQLGVLQTDPNWDHRGYPRGITRRFILAMAVMVIGVILIGLPLVFTAIALVMPPPFYYNNLPFKVCRPIELTSPSEGGGIGGTSCTPQQPGDVFRPSDVVPFIVDRCANDSFGSNPVLAYTVGRNVVNVQTEVRTILPMLSTNVLANGCTISVTYSHQLPPVLPPGQYYLEGVATVYGRFKTVNSYFRTDIFTVDKPLPPEDS